MIGDQMLRGTEEFAGVYLDNIIIYREARGQDIDNIQKVFEWKKNTGLTIKLKKCSFGVSECTYLGHKIENGGVKPEETKVKAITGKNEKGSPKFSWNDQILLMICT